MSKSTTDWQPIDKLQCGAAYTYNATTTKLSYFASEQLKNKVNAVKLNVTYLMAKGFKR